MLKRKGLKQLLCTLLVASLTMPGAAFDAYCAEGNEIFGIFSEVSNDEETVSYGNPAADAGEASFAADGEIPSSEDEAVYYDPADESAAKQGAEGYDDESLSEDTLSGESLSDESLSDESLTDSSLSDLSKEDKNRKEETLVGAAKGAANIADGIYVLQSAANAKACVGIAQNSTENQANAELVSKNGGYAQAFYIKKESDGNYSIVNYHTGKALHIPGGVKTPGANVVQYAPRNMDSQRWVIRRSSVEGCYTIQSVYNNLFLYSAEKNAAIGTNVNLNITAANNKAMLWKLVPAYGKVAAEARLVDANYTKGYYRIKVNGYSTLSLHVADASTSDGASIRVKKADSSYSQAFQILPQGGGLYKIKNVNSEKYFATSNGSGGTANVVQKSASGSDKSQLWHILKDPANGKIVFKPSNATHGVLTTRGLASGNNVLNDNFSAAAEQYWSISKTSVYEKDQVYQPECGVYYLSPSAASSKAIGIEKGALTNSTNVQLTSMQDSNALKWRVIPYGDGTYRIQNLKSGKTLDVFAAKFQSGSNIQQYTVNHTKAQKWRFRYTGKEDGSVYIVSAGGSFDIDISGGQYLTSANIELNKKSTAGTQQYALKKAGITYEGWIAASSGMRYYYKNGAKLLGWKKINNNYYYFDKSSGTMARNTSIDGYTIDSEGISNKSDQKTIIGGRTLRAFLTNAVAPAGKVLYVWGGGHGGMGSIANGGDSSKIGIQKEWITFCTSHASPAYSTEAGRAPYKYHYGSGLDCSGYVAWAVYNTIYTRNDVECITKLSTETAPYYIERGWCTNSSGGAFKPGDIVSRSGHVWISMGTCSDGSVLVMHSSMEGCQLTATYGKSIELAKKYMKIAAPSWPYAIHAGYRTDYVTKASWKVDGTGIFTDPDGVRNMSAEQVCKLIFGS